ncbi:MAG: hypothetical protein SGI77_03780 [Pirellulaceae bacterium]|nr:hypothetical protein [Pirellulaceae bacterium]
MQFARHTGLVLISLFALGCEIKSDADLAREEEGKIIATPPPLEARPAEVGVGIKGQSLKDETGVGKVISQPAMVLFQTKERIAFEIQIPHALNLFKASEGRSPESHEEFIDKIIKPNQIKLPKLPEGMEYRYRPDDAQLWVEPIASK